MPPSPKPQPSNQSNNQIKKRKNATVQDLAVPKKKTSPPPKKISDKDDSKARSNNERKEKEKYNSKEKKQKISRDSTDSKGKCTKKDSGKSKTTANELFGGGDDQMPEHLNEGLYSYLQRRLPNGYAKQTNDAKLGSHYVEVKVWNSDDIEKVAPTNRWRHLIISLKNRSDTDTEAWRLLSQYLSAVRKEFKDCPVSYRSSYYS